MNTKHHSTLTYIFALSLFAMGCGALSTPVLIPSNTPSPEPAKDLTTETSLPGPLNTETPVPTPTEPPLETYIAYVQNNELLVTHVIGGQPLDTQQYTDHASIPFVIDVDWSPSGEYLTYSAYINSFPHTVFVNPLQGGTPVDLGISSDWAWSPDGTLLAFEHEYELWVYSLASGQSRRLTTHLGTDWLWYKLAFTPAGDALVAAGTSTDNMDAHGNTLYRLYQVPLDGSAAGSYPPVGIPLTEEISGRLPLALRLSPDNQKLAMITTTYVSTCATSTQYLVGKPDASDLHELPIDSLAAFGGPEQKMYLFGDSLVWTPQSDGIWVNGYVRDCDKLTGIVGGPQISHLTLDGQEHEIISGVYSSLSLDRSGTLLGVVKAGAVPHVQILGLDGHLVLDLGEGTSAALRP